MLQNTEFAVVDVETTGLFPKGNDRIIEIALVRIDWQGRVIDEYATLINPRRDMGPIHIHGITASDVRNAPEFMEVAGDVLSRLAGAVFVAHNVRFDMGFVRSEMERIGCKLPVFPLLCTMQLTKRAAPGVRNRRLQDVCRHFGIPLSAWHSARADARAVAKLFTACVETLEGGRRLSLADIGVEGDPVATAAWPHLPASGKAYPRERAAKEAAQRPCYIAELVAKLPPTSGFTANVEEYLALLDRVLEDRRITADERDALLALAGELGIDRRQVMDAHLRYMGDLIHVALEDNVITDAEMGDLDAVRRLLDVPTADFDEFLGKLKDE